MRLNKNRFELRFGLIFLILWIFIFVFHATWDGWIWEWNYFGYNGPNQHFDFDLFDLKITRLEDGGIIYNSTNNLHNLIYICFFTFFMGWFGLIFDIEWAKQGLMATSGISFIAAIATLKPWINHTYILQTVYDVIHVSGIIMATYLFSKKKISLIKIIPGLLGTWILYLLSRILLEPWPYWTESRNAYFSINQINNMPFYFYGFEYLIVIVVLMGVNFIIHLLNLKMKNRILKAVFPLLIFTFVYLVMNSLNFIEVPLVDLRAWKSP